MKQLTTGKIWLFAVGQFGWSMLSGLISNWMVYFYLPTQDRLDAGQIAFFPQGAVIFGIATIIGAITALGRVVDAFTDPWIASLSDHCKSKNGRRIPFLKWSALPLAAFTVLTFWSPINGNSWINAVFLLLMVVAYYISITAYCTPYNALIPEMGKNQKQRLDISTAISFTFIAGTAVAYVAPTLWGMFEGMGMERIPAMRLTFLLIAIPALICMYVPVFAIKEKDYVDAKPVEESAFKSLTATFRLKDFRRFVLSDVAYWVALTMFQTGLAYYVTLLLKLDESMTTLFFVLMTALSLVFYIPINKIAPKLGKKKLILIAFVGFTVCFAYTGLMGDPLSFINPTVQGIILCVAAAGPMAIFGILPQAVVADIARYDSMNTGANREGMFYAARTFAFKLGQSLALLIFTSVAAILSDKTAQAATDAAAEASSSISAAGCRVIAIAAAVICLLGGLAFFFYDEKKVTKSLE